MMATTAWRRAGFARVRLRPRGGSGLSSRGHHGLAGRRRGRHAFDHDRISRGRRDHVQLLNRNVLDALRRQQRLDLEQQLAADFLLLAALALQLLDLIPMAKQHEMLPGPEEHHADEKAANQHPPPEIAMALMIDLPDDRVVSDVLADLVFEVDAAHAIRSTARSFALRARGLAAHSDAAAITGFLVRTRTSSSPRSSIRIVCFTTRS